MATFGAELIALLRRVSMMGRRSPARRRTARLLAGLQIRLDPTMPRGEIRFEDDSGREVGRIIGIGAPRQ